MKMVDMYSRYQHKSEVLTYLQQHFSRQKWEITLPPKGMGNETYFAESNGQAYFIKLGAKIERYQVMSSLGLTPKVIESGSLKDGTSVLVQNQIHARKPTRKDFQEYFSEFAEIIHTMHRNDDLRRILPKKSSNSYKDDGLKILATIRQRWEKQKGKVPSSVKFVEDSLEKLEDEIQQFCGSGLVASHNDICNANWLVSQDGNIYLIDLELMSRDDPALDIGALLWWYYPVKMRDKFLKIVRYESDENFRNRMRIRMAVHCLNIILPRENSYDKFEDDSFEDSLEDFRVIIAGRENPKGYND
jgi:thiamine kinase-like enzyme